jgi:hypothetical protein
MIKIITTLVVTSILIFSNVALAQKIEEPAECILNTIRGNNSSSTSYPFYLIKRTCTLKFISDVEPLANSLAPILFSKATLQYNKNILNGYSNSFFELLIRNDSNERIITVNVGITNKKSGETEVVRFIAANGLVSPLSTGTLYGNVMPIIDSKVFWEENTWAILKVLAIP